MPAAPPLCMSGAGEGGSCSCRGGGGSGGGRERRPLERCVRAVRAHVWVGGGGRSRGGRALAGERRGIVQGCAGPRCDVTSGGRRRARRAGRKLSTMRRRGTRARDGGGEGEPTLPLPRSRAAHVGPDGSVALFSSLNAFWKVTLGSQKLVSLNCVTVSRPISGR